MTATYQDIEIDTIDNPRRPLVLEGQVESGQVPVSGTAGGCDQTPDASAWAGRSVGTRRRDQTRPGGRPKSGEPDRDASSLIEEHDSETASNDRCGVFVLLGGQARVVRMRCDSKSCDECGPRIADGHFAPVRSAFDGGVALYVATVSKEDWPRLRNRRAFRDRATYKRIPHGISSTVIADVEFSGSARISSREALDDVLDSAFGRCVEQGGGNISASRTWAHEPGRKKRDGPPALIVTVPGARREQVLAAWNLTHDADPTDEEFLLLAKLLRAETANWLKYQRTADEARTAAGEREWEAMAIEYLERPF